MTARGNFSTKSPLTRSVLHTADYNRTTTVKLNKTRSSFQMGGFLGGLNLIEIILPRLRIKQHLEHETDFNETCQNPEWWHWKYSQASCVCLPLFWGENLTVPPQEAYSVQGHMALGCGYTLCGQNINYQVSVTSYQTISPQHAGNWANSAHTRF